MCPSVASKVRRKLRILDKGEDEPVPEASVFCFCRTRSHRLSLLKEDVPGAADPHMDGPSSVASPVSRKAQGSGDSTWVEAAVSPEVSLQRSCSTQSARAPTDTTLSIAKEGMVHRANAGPSHCTISAFMGHAAER